MKHKHLRLTNRTERKFKVTSHSLRLPFMQLGCFVNHKKKNYRCHICRFIFSFFILFVSGNIPLKLLAHFLDSFWKAYKAIPIFPPYDAF